MDEDPFVLFYLHFSSHEKYFFVGRETTTDLLFNILSYFKKIVNWVRPQLKSFAIRISSGCKLSRKNVKLCASFLLNFAQISNLFLLKIYCAEESANDVQGAILESHQFLLLSEYS